MPYNTNNPTGTNGSTDPRDLYDNAANLDLMATSQTLTVVPDRLGQPRTTLHGYDVKANAVIDAMGMYRLADQTFGGGTTITSNKQLLLWASADGGTGWHYYWSAEMPPGGKVVPAGSTPSSTGGEGPGGWLAWDDLEQRLSGNEVAIGASKSGFIGGRMLLVAENFGVSSELSVEENTLALQRAIDNALLYGYKGIEINSNVTANELSRKGQVGFIGNGSISGVFRKKVARYSDPESASWNDIIPEVHLKRFLSKNNPIVVIVGDSLATDSADIPVSQMLWARLKAKLVQSYPEKNITFHNRAIGGESYFTAVGLPLSFPVWYSNPAIGWPAYVAALNPDLIFFNFGMNDSSDVQFNTLKIYQQYFDNTDIFPSGRPDVVYCTNLTPSIDTPIYPFGTESGQLGRDMVAGLTRSYAKHTGSGLLDFHRQCCIIKDGFDPIDTSLALVGPMIVDSGSIEGTIACCDFKIEMEISALPVGSNIAVKMGEGEPSDIAGRGSFAIIGNATGVFGMDLYANAENIYAGLTSETPIPAGPFTLVIEKKNHSVYLSFGGAVIIEYHRLISAGGDFIPRAGDATYTSGPITSAILHAGFYKSYKQSIFNDEMWGSPGESTSTRTPMGGNGVNHPTTFGSSAVYQPVLDNTIWGTKLPKSSVGIVSLASGWNQLAGFSTCLAYRNGNMVTVDYHLVPPSDGSTGVAFTTPLGYRPPAGISAFFAGHQASGDRCSGQILPDGTVQFNTGVTGWCYGSFSFWAP